MRTNVLSQKGVTLMELLIVLAIMGIVLTLGGSVLVMGIRSYNKDLRSIDVQQNVRLAMEYITGELLNAKKDDVYVFSNPNGPDELQIGNLYFKLGGTTLRLDQEYDGSFNGQPIAEGIVVFEVEEVLQGEEKKIVLSIAGGSEDQGSHLSLSTEIWLRK